MFRSSCNRQKGRILSKTVVAGQLASWVKRTAGRRINNAWNFAFKPVRWGLPGYIDFGNSSHKGHCIGMKRIIVKLVCGCLLDDSAHIHYGNGIAGKLNDSQVMSDKQIRQGKLLLEVFEKVEYLGLDGNIERAYRLVTNNKFWLEDECAGDTDTLPLAA